MLGRKVIDVRVCACPTRDLKSDEQAAVSNKGIKRKGSSTQVGIRNCLLKEFVSNISCILMNPDEQIC